MAKNQKQKTSVKAKPVARKKRPTKKKAFRVDTVDSAVFTAFDTLQSQAAKGKAKLEVFADVSKDRAGILSIVKGLEGQVETAFKLKEVLEADLDEIQNNLAEQTEARTRLEVQVTSLEAQAALVEQLREDISFAEEERSKFADLLGQTQPQLEDVTAERDSLTDQMASAEVYTKELEDEKITLEAHVTNLKDKISDAEQTREKLAVMTVTNKNLSEQLYDFRGRLKTSEELKNSVEKKLTVTSQTSQSLRENIEVLQTRFADVDNLATDLRVQLADQQAANKELKESQRRLKNEMKLVKINYEAARKELDTFKNAMRDIRSEAARTSGRVLHRYFSPNGRKSKSGKSKSRK